MNEKLKFRQFAPKALFTVLSIALFIVLTKVKLTPIFGIDTQFTASVMFGPVISEFLGIGFGIWCDSSFTVVWRYYGHLQNQVYNKLVDVHTNYLRWNLFFKNV